MNARGGFLDALPMFIVGGLAVYILSQLIFPVLPVVFDGIDASGFPYGGVVKLFLGFMVGLVLLAVLWKGYLLLTGGGGYVQQ